MIKEELLLEILNKSSLNESELDEFIDKLEQWVKQQEEYYLYVDENYNCDECAVYMLCYKITDEKNVRKEFKGNDKSKLLIQVGYWLLVQIKLDNTSFVTVYGSSWEGHAIPAIPMSRCEIQYNARSFILIIDGQRYDGKSKISRKNLCMKQLEAIDNAIFRVEYFAIQNKIHKIFHTD